WSESLKRIAEGPPRWAAPRIFSPSRGSGCQRLAECRRVRSANPERRPSPAGEDQGVPHVGLSDRQTDERGQRVQPRGYILDWDRNVYRLDPVVLASDWGRNPTYWRFENQGDGEAGCRPKVSWELSLGRPEP